MKGLFADINDSGDRIEAAEHTGDNNRIGLKVLVRSGALHLSELEWESFKRIGDEMLTQRKDEDARP